MKKDYMFSSIFTIEEDNILISFPDLQGCLSCAKTFEEGNEECKGCYGTVLNYYGKGWYRNTQSDY